VLVAAGQMAGRDSALWKWVGSWAAAANLGRAVTSIVFGLLLIVAVAAHRRWLPRLGAAGFAVVAGTAVAVTLLTLPLPATYPLMTTLAVLSTLTAVVIMAALLGGLLNDSMDQLLWLALAAYALKETLRVSLFAVLAWWSMGRDVAAYRLFYWLGIAVSLTMVSLAVRRLRAAADGRPVPAPFERLHSLRHPAMGSRIA
jgi:hypothetical protein